MTAKLKFPLHIPFVEKLGFELISFGDGESELSVDLTDAHLNSWAVAHGGVVMTLLDVAMAIAARSGNRGDSGDLGPGVVTIEMKTSFMRPGERRLRGLGKLLHRTVTMAFCEASVIDDAGRLCAHATGTFKFIKALPGRDKTIKPLQHNNGDEG
jgi:uncharacterized protein (TIGR00369 family)